jgi:hypothetical protein
MSKRVSNKRNGGGARSYRTHLVHAKRVATRAAVIAEQRATELQERANRFKAHVATLTKGGKVGLFERARMAIRRLIPVVLALASTVGMAEEWEHTHHVASVTITVEQVTRRELAQLSGLAAADVRSIDYDHGMGFSVLRINTKTREARCTIYVVVLDDAETLAHETKHCNGWTH